MFCVTISGLNEVEGQNYYLVQALITPEITVTKEQKRA